jgi:hypothetical protein
MTNALTNASKLRAWADPVALGADPSGVIPADAFMTAAIATGLPVRIPAGATLRLISPIRASLSIGQDFILVGAGREASRLLFSEASAGGIAVTYSSNAGGQAQGNKTAVRISGLDIETERAGGGAAISIINTPPAGQVNETQVAVDLQDLRTNGASDAAYWDVHQELRNVTFPSLRDMEAQDASNRGIALSLNSTGDYSAVEFAIDNYRANQVGVGMRVRGRCEGVYASHMVIVGGKIGIDWQATTVAGGKKPLLLLTASHINVTETAVKGIDIAQVIASDTLVYVTNSTTAPSVGFDFSATGNLSNENHRLSGVTIIGLGSRIGSQSTGVKLGADVAGCTIDAKIDNLNLGVENLGLRNLLAASSSISNCNTRTTGFSDLGYYGEIGTTISADDTLQMELSNGSHYSRDRGREQLRVETFVHTVGSSTETITRAYDRPFRTDTIVVIPCFGEGVSNPGLSVNTAASTKDNASFTITGATPGDTYRINYIAYGY